MHRRGTSIITALTLIASHLAIAMNAAAGVEEIAAARAAREDAKVMRAIEPYVLASKAAYAPKGKDSVEGLELLHWADDEVSGFRAKAYIGKGELVIAFAGTDPKELSASMLCLIAPSFLEATGCLARQAPDVRTDILAFGAGKKPAQFAQAVAFLRAAREKAKRSLRVVACGHSLGGALATYVAMLNRIDSVAFNAPPLNDKLFSEAPPRNVGSWSKGPWYWSFTSSGEPGWALGQKDMITKLAERHHRAIGRKAPITSLQLQTGCKADKLCHSIDNYLRREAGNVSRP